MIFIKLKGGLGNQMFQYAIAKSLALKTKQKVFIDKSFFKTYDLHQFSLKHFNVNIPYVTLGIFLQKILLKLRLQKNYYEPSLRFDNAANSCNKPINVLNGYFASEKYFKEIREQLLIDFTVTSNLKEETENLCKEIKAENSIAIHIRRGDFLQHETHNTNKDDYYIKAINYIENTVDKPVFYFFSDDINWVKSNYKLTSKCVFVDFNNAESNYEDLFLMSKCKHNIIANSTFSWWSAWLNVNPKKIVIAPKVWLKGKEEECKDVVPENWLTF